MVAVPCDLGPFRHFSSLAGGCSSSVCNNVSCSIWNGQVETDALSRFNRMAILTHTQSTSGTSVPLVELMYIVFTRMPG